MARGALGTDFRQDDQEGGRLVTPFPAKAGVQESGRTTVLSWAPASAGERLLGRRYALTAAFDRAAKLFRSFCSLGGITAMQYGFERPEVSQ